MDISLETWNTQDIIQILNDVQEEWLSGPWFWKDSVQQCRGIPEQGSRKELMEEQGEGRVLMGLARSGDPERGKSFDI